MDIFGFFLFYYFRVDVAKELKVIKRKIVKKKFVDEKTKKEKDIVFLISEKVHTYGCCLFYAKP